MAQESWINKLTDAIINRLQTFDNNKLKSRVIYVTPTIGIPASALRGREQFLQLLIEDSSPRNPEGTSIIKTVGIFIALYQVYLADDPTSSVLAEKALQRLAEDVSTALHDYFLPGLDFVVCPIKEVTPFGISQVIDNLKGFMYKHGKFEVDVGFTSWDYWGE